MDVNTRCLRCDAPRSFLVRAGFYARADDAKFIQRFKCKRCTKKFSATTFSATYRQKERRINSTVRFCFASNMYPRDIAELVGVNIKTTVAADEKDCNGWMMHGSSVDLVRIIPT
ncbi:MAG: hypothetical protein AB8B79_04265 [Granulosicoccus sp.]